MIECILLIFTNTIREIPQLLAIFFQIKEPNLEKERIPKFGG